MCCAITVDIKPVGTVKMHIIDTVRFNRISNLRGINRVRKILLMESSIARRRQTGDPSKDVREMRLLGETGFQGDFHDGQLGMRELVAGEVDPALPSKLTDGRSVVAMKLASDVHGMDAHFTGKVGKTQRFLEPTAQNFPNVAQPARWMRFPPGTNGAAELRGHFTGEALNHERRFVVHVLPLLVKVVRQPLHCSAFKGRGLIGQRAVLFDVLGPPRGDFQIKAARARGRDAVFMDHFGRPEEDGVSREGQLSNGEAFGKRSREHKPETGALVSVRVKTKSRGIRRVRESQVAEPFYAAHIALNARKGRALRNVGRSSGWLWLHPGRW